MWNRLQVAGFHLAGRWALRRFERRLSAATEVNEQTLAAILRHNQDTHFGRAHAFAAIIQSPDQQAAYGERVSLSSYTDYEPYIERIASGEADVLCADPVTLLAGTSGTTDRPKRIPRTRAAQSHHLLLVVLAQQAVVDRGIAGARSPARGINLMSLFAPPPPGTSEIPLMSGLNAGLGRLRRLIPLLWTSPVPVFLVKHQPTAQYLHALFGLRQRTSLYIETPFAPQVVAWLALMERQRARLVNDLRRGTISEHLDLTDSQRQALAPLLWADPHRAAEVEQAFAEGQRGILPRLWPTMRYIRTVTSGSFALALPRLRWLAGPAIPIQSGCYSSSEGIVGMNLRTDGSNNYVLAIGTAYFEFIPFSHCDDPRPPTVPLKDLQVEQDYEIVMTTQAGLYRYRLGDVVRVKGWHGTAPVLEYRWRRGTILNLIGEKTTEWHTHAALQATVARWVPDSEAVVDYTVAGGFDGGIGQYTFYVEVRDDASRAQLATEGVSAFLDESLGSVNRLYHHLGRQAERLASARLRIVRPGTFDAVAQAQLVRAGGISPTQIKTPRVVTAPDQLAILEGQSAPH